jgi:ABC-2 type transport system ATP-binding protein
MSVIQARGLSKSFGRKVALDSVDLTVDARRIVGLIGPNGAGKTTALNAIVGLIPFDGELNVLGCNPWRERTRLMLDACFIADVAVLPRWIRTSQLFDYVAGVHPKFDRARAESLLANSGIDRHSKVRHLSKGMVAQLHLAVALAIDARLLLLDEPTLGLDAMFRKQFYDNLLSDYLERDRTIVISTHEVEQVQHILTDVVFIDRGRVVLASSVDAIEGRFLEVLVPPDRIVRARNLHPLNERSELGRARMIFDGADADELRSLGEVTTPSVADLFVAVIESGRKS